MGVRSSGSAYTERETSPVAVVKAYVRIIFIFQLATIGYLSIVA